jgi:holo-[acyl-carrier protein] synthase
MKAAETASTQHPALSTQRSVLGIGIDIVETERIEASLERFGDRFLKRVYHPGEIEYAKSMKFPALHLAARFAAKEAISKAFGTGIGKQLGWTDMEIRRKASGEPYVVLHGKGAELAKKRSVAEVLVSLSHCKAYSAANAILLSDCRAGMPEGLPAIGGSGAKPLGYSRPTIQPQS